MAYDTSATRRYGVTQVLAVGAASAQSAVVDAGEVMLHAKVACYVKVGANPTAVVGGDSFPLEAGEKFHMRLSHGDKIAAIRDGASGSLYVTAVS